MNKFIAASMCLVIGLLPFAFAEEKRSSDSVEVSKPITEQKYEVVNVKSFLNIRSGPGTIYSILRAIPSTEKNITIVESKQLDKSTWVKIKHEDQYGWVNQVYLKPSGVKKFEPSLEKEEEHMPLWLTMSGVYALTNVEPMKGQKMDTHILFQLESEQAKVIYDAIKTPSFIDKCTGANAKKVGEMLCLHYPAPEEKRQVQQGVKQDNVITEVEGVQKAASTDALQNEVQQTQLDQDVGAEEGVEEKEFFDASEEITDIYECHFSINIMQQKIQQGIPCEK